MIPKALAMTGGKTYLAALLLAFMGAKAVARGNEDRRERGYVMLVSALGLAGVRAKLGRDLVPDDLAKIREELKSLQERSREIERNTLKSNDFRF